jgi:hypothetical protein
MIFYQDNEDITSNSCSIDDDESLFTIFDDINWNFQGENLANHLADDLITLLPSQEIISSNSPVSIAHNGYFTGIEQYTVDTSSFHAGRKKEIVQKKPKKGNELALIRSTPRDESLMYHSTSQLLDAYPMLRTLEYWHDVVKDASPKKRKRALDYDAGEFDRLMTIQLPRLLKLRNHMKHCLSVVSAEGNKKRLLKIVGELEGAGINYVSGGGDRPDTKRVKLLYDVEAGLI